MRTITKIVMYLSLAGLIATVFSNIVSYFGIVAFREIGAIVLGFGVIVLGLAAAILFSSLEKPRGLSAKVFWSRFLPHWCRTVYFILLFYGIASICTALALDSKWKEESAGDEIRGRTLAIRIFSAGWMFLYSIPAGICFAILKATNNSENRIERKP